MAWNNEVRYIWIQGLCVSMDTWRQNNHKMLHGNFTVMVCSHCPTLTPITRHDKNRLHRIVWRCSYRHQQIPIGFCVNLSLSMCQVLGVRLCERTTAVKDTAFASGIFDLFNIILKQQSINVFNQWLKWWKKPKILFIFTVKKPVKWPVKVLALYLLWQCL